MTRRALAAGLLLALAASGAGCGKVGPPVRASRAKPAAAAPAPDATAVPAPEEDSKEKTK